MTPRSKPESCRECPLYAHGTDFSAVEGTGSSGVLLVGEASGEMEARDQLPFRPYAPAGSVLERTLRRMGHSREEFAISNCIRCRPRDNWLERAPWEYSALRHCRSNLDRVLAERRPRAIVALGGIATRELTGMASEAQGVSHLAGYILPLNPAGDPFIDQFKIPVIPNFHPAFLRRGAASHSGVFARILQRALNVAAGRDREWLWGIDPDNSATWGNLQFLTHPSWDDAYSFFNYVMDNPSLSVAEDLETNESASIDEDARDGFADTFIRQAQFAVLRDGRPWAIALPWEGWARDIIIGMLATQNRKFGHNWWLFDDKVLRACAAREGWQYRAEGRTDDTLAMFHHWQPDLPAHLQFCAQFVQFPFPWKHLAGTDIEFYGCCDVASDLLLGEMLERTLKRDGIWGDGSTGYRGQVYEVRPVLAEMERRGLPVDNAARLALDAEFSRAQTDLGKELAALVPEACKRVHPKQGYKGVPPEVKAAGGQVDDRLFTELGEDGECYRYAIRDFSVPDIDAVTGDPVARVTTRWCRVYEFNPNSALQLLAYMRAKKHPVPKSRKNTDDGGNPKDTTDKKELVRLAHKTGDTFYLRVIEYRELSKMRGTYIEGFAPGPDGRVHTTFTFDTGTGQLSARNPNVTNFPKRMRLAKQIRRMIAAPDGYELAECDYKSYHVLTTGYCAGDASYMRMARLDMHSFVAWHLMKLPGADRLLAMPDGELADRLRWFKTDEKRKRVRDNQAKPAILGIGFGMGYRRLYQENLEYFDSEKDARRLHDLLRALFPKVFAWQERIRRQAHEQQFLKSPFGHIRRFYEVFRWDSRKGDWAPGDQAEEAVAFLPANIAFGNIRETMKEVARLEIDERFGLCDHIHDSFLWCYPRPRRDEFLATVIPVLTAPSRILVHPVIAPQGLQVDVETVVGPNWAQMEAPAADTVLSRPA